VTAAQIQDASPQRVPDAGRSDRRTPTLVLASRSPRRRELLTEFGIPHHAAEPALDDAQLWPGAVPPHCWVTALATLKAWACLRNLPAGSPTIVLGADTACIKQGVLIGTPVDASEAEKIIRFLSGGEHRVVTGVALISSEGIRELWCDRAVVRVGVLSESQIRQYIESGRWAGKAGAYNLRERIDAGWPIAFEGDPTSIMGLPMEKLVPSLARMGISPDPKSREIRP